MKVYLDYAAATPVEPSVIDAMLPFFKDSFYNPSATYLLAQQSRKALEDARADIAHWLGSRPSEVFFMAGGTEANNTAIDGIMKQYPDGNIVTSAIEHESVIAPATQYDCRVVRVNPEGRLDLDDLAAKIDDQTVMVSVMYANNEIGTIQPIREISKIIVARRDERRQSGNKLPILLHSDACQASNYLDLHVARLGVDLMTVNGGKIYGPKQSAVLYVKAGVIVEPIIRGGGQERGIRSGTENVASAVGLAKALDLVQTDRHQESSRLQNLQTAFIQRIQTELPDAIINGSLKHRLPNNIHVTFPGIDNERLLIQLDEAGIMAAAGSACSASNDEPSHVLNAIGISDKDAQSSVRFTLGRQTSEQMIDFVVDTLASQLQTSE